MAERCCEAGCRAHAVLDAPFSDPCIEIAILGYKSADIVVDGASGARLEEGKMRGLDDKVAIVSGSYSGIGEAIARRLAEEGARVVLANSNRERGAAAAERIRAEGGTAEAMWFDLSDEDSIVALMAATRERLGGLSILCNSAAITRGPVMAQDNQVEALARETWQRAFDVNATGTMLMIKHALPLIVAEGAVRSSTSDRARA